MPALSRQRLRAEALSVKFAGHDIAALSSLPLKRVHFYEKNAPKHTPPWVKRFPVPRSEDAGEINYILGNDRATLIWARAATASSRKSKRSSKTRTIPLNTSR